jgi:DNA-binding NarL/FixJ family response regulator
MFPRNLRRDKRVVRVLAHLKHGREHCALTDREAEVVEFIMEGFSVADAAMKISPKIGLKNRIQFYNFFENRRRLEDWGSSEVSRAVWTGR